MQRIVNAQGEASQIHWFTWRCWTVAYDFIFLPPFNIWPAATHLYIFLWFVTKQILLSSEDGLTRLVNISVSISRKLTRQKTFLAGLLGPIRTNAKRLFKGPEETAQDIRRMILLCWLFITLIITPYKVARILSSNMSMPLYNLKRTLGI